MRGERSGRNGVSEQQQLRPTVGNRLRRHRPPNSFAASWAAVAKTVSRRLVEGAVVQHEPL